MPMSETDARMRADGVIIQLIQHQPQLMAPQSPHEKSGENVAAFIAALRKGLIDMYKAQG